MSDGYINKRFMQKLTGIKETKVPKSIKPRSEKMTEEMKKYNQERVKFLKANPVCAANLEGCKRVSSTIHHRAGRIGEKLHDKKDWLALCLPCHVTVHSQELLSKTSGLSKSRHIKEPSVSK